MIIWGVEPNRSCRVVLKRPSRKHWKSFESEHQYTTVLWRKTMPEINISLLLFWIFLCSFIRVSVYTAAFIVFVHEINENDSFSVLKTSFPSLVLVEKNGEVWPVVMAMRCKLSLQWLIFSHSWHSTLVLHHLSQLSNFLTFFFILNEEV